ncbi:hypothetical protein BFV94_3607 [Alteromonas macleodii]|uniref:Uncharacterized protein n=1 Tax=Alteromonas macleodii TaxID=28108 RepID=A0AB36FRK6_ALTMA|nr:hypothetical protein BFV93_3599 [Alteromonas macleodii]OES27975.1 hypothetical protein BFV94_3607 [Alteromonas macleodii]OES28134.1 hypothetical protein BFV95_3609 [Alteromonas macleodii]OES39840.1 hypothetical protein BFV96_3592 [Alteromonas macleodii]
MKPLCSNKIQTATISAYFAAMTLIKKRRVLIKYMARMPCASAT